MGTLKAPAPSGTLVYPLRVAPARRLDDIAWSKPIDLYVLSCGSFRKSAGKPQAGAVFQRSWTVRLLSLQRHFSGLTKFACAKSRLSGRNRKAQVVFAGPTLLGSTKHVCRNVVVGLLGEPP